MAFDDDLRTLKEAFSESAQTLKGTLGVQSRTDTKFYESLEPRDFEELTMKFGLTETINFVQDMETQRMRQ